MSRSLIVTGSFDRDTRFPLLSHARALSVACPRSIGAASDAFIVSLRRTLNVLQSPTRRPSSPFSLPAELPPIISFCDPEVPQRLLPRQSSVARTVFFPPHSGKGVPAERNATPSSPYNPRRVHSATCLLFLIFRSRRGDVGVAACTEPRDQ